MCFMATIMSRPWFQRYPSLWGTILRVVVVWMALLMVPGICVCCIILFLCALQLW